MRAGASGEVRHRGDWVGVMEARRDEEWAPPVRLRRLGIVVEPRTDAHSTSRLAASGLCRNALAWPLQGAARRKVRFARSIGAVAPSGRPSGCGTLRGIDAG